MSKDTTDELREAIAKIMTDYGVDFYEGNLRHRTEQRLALLKEFQDQILALISNREKLARIDERIKQGDENNSENYRVARLTTLRKELDGGQR